MAVDASVPEEPIVTAFRDAAHVLSEDSVLYHSALSKAMKASEKLYADSDPILYAGQSTAIGMQSHINIYIHMARIIWPLLQVRRR
jgi:hypothetical protein